MKWILLVLLVANLVIAIDNNRKIKQSMADNKQAFDDLVDQLNTATDEIANDLETLRGQIQGAGMDADAEGEVLAKLDALKTRLQGLGADPEQPIPPTE